MATLDAATLTMLRQGVSSDIAGITWTKAQVNAAFQALEDTFSSAGVQNAFSSAIDTALSPATATNAQKRALIKFWLRNRFERGN